MPLPDTSFVKNRVWIVCGGESGDPKNGLNQKLEYQINLLIL